MRMRPVGNEMFHAEGWTNRYDEASGRLSKFCERPQKQFEATVTGSYFECSLAQ
jgi:hypothetical protein